MPACSMDMSLPTDLREPVMQHLDALRAEYQRRGWGGRTGFGKRPAVLVVDLARAWTDPEHQMGTPNDDVVEATCRVVDAARDRGVPVFFTTKAHDPADPPGPQSSKVALEVDDDDLSILRIDERLRRRPTEKIIYKCYASGFKGTNLHELLAAHHADTLIVTGVSTSHCIYATCRDAADSYHVIVPREAVGDRCELFHATNLLDIDLELGDVMPAAEVIEYLATR